MNDCPFNRVVLEIVELLQDLRAQGMAFVFTLNSTGSFDCYLFTDIAHRDAWIDRSQDALITVHVIDNDVQDALDVFNKLDEYKTEERANALENRMERAEYLEER